MKKKRENPEIKEFKECLDRIIKNENYQDYSDKIWKEVQPKLIKGIKKTKNPKLYYLEIHRHYWDIVKKIDLMYEERKIEYHNYVPKKEFIERIEYIVDLIKDYVGYRETGEFPNYYDNNNLDERKLKDFREDYLTTEEKKLYIEYYLGILKKKELELYEKINELKSAYNKIKDKNWKKHETGELEKEDRDNESKISEDLYKKKQEYEYLNKLEYNLENAYEKIVKEQDRDKNIDNNQNYHPKNSKEWVLYEIGKMLNKDYRIIETEPEDFVKIMIEGGKIDFVKQQGNKKYLKLLYYYFLGKSEEIEKKFMTVEELKKVKYPGVFNKSKSNYAYILDNIQTFNDNDDNTREKFEEELKTLLKGFFETHE